MIRSRKTQYLIVIMAAWLGLPGIARAQAGTSSLSWQQRFLGILPLVKPDPNDPVIVMVNGTPITVAEVADYAKTEATMINATSTRASKAVWRDATENLINRRLLIDEARRRKIVVPDQQVIHRARDFRLTAVGGESVASGSTRDPLLLKQVRGSMMIERMLDEEFRRHRVRPTDAQIKRYYDEHKDLFIKRPGRVRISHIAVKLPPHATEAQKEAARKKIARLYQEARQARDFAALARKSSEDQRSAQRGGDLGYFFAGQLPPVVEKQAFSTPVGGLSEILESNIGMSFIKVTARDRPQYRPLSEVKPRIALVLLNYNQDALIKALLKRLNKRAKIQFKKLPAAARRTRL